MHFQTDTRSSTQKTDPRTRRIAPHAPGTLSPRDLRRIVAEMLG